MIKPSLLDQNLTRHSALSHIQLNNLSFYRRANYRLGCGQGLKSDTFVRVRPIMCMMALMLLLTVSCASPGNQPSTEPANLDPTQDSIAMSEDALSPQLQQALLEAVGTQQNLSPDQLSITKTEEADWPDACLGLAGADEFCAQIIVPGWAVEVTDGQQTWRYRTDLEMTQVKLDE